MNQKYVTSPELSKKLEELVNWEKRFDKKFGIDWFGNDYRLPDLHQPTVKSKEIKQFIEKELATQRMKAITMVKDEIVKADKYTIGALERVRTNMIFNL